MEDKNKRIAVSVAICLIVIGVIGFFLIKQNASGDINTSPGQDQSIFQYNSQPYIGQKNAPIRIVEFGDFKCPNCKIWKDTVYPDMYKHYIATGMAKMYFINFPFLGPDSSTAAEIGEAVAAQNMDAFFKYYDLVYEKQGDEADIWATPTFLYSIIADHIPEINLTKIKQDVENKKYLASVKMDIGIAEQLGLNSVPTIYINEKKLDDLSYSNIKLQIEYEASQ